jgi:starch synthase
MAKKKTVKKQVNTANKKVTPETVVPAPVKAEVTKSPIEKKVETKEVTPPTPASAPKTIKPPVEKETKSVTPIPNPVPPVKKVAKKSSISQSKEVISEKVKLANPTNQTISKASSVSSEKPVEIAKVLEEPKPQAVKKTPAKKVVNTTSVGAKKAVVKKKVVKELTASEKKAIAENSIAQEQAPEHEASQFRHRPAPMYIVHITPEMAPVAKVGGLGDVVAGLGRETEIRGNTVEYILPKYDCMRYNHIYCLDKVYENLWVPWYDGAIPCDVFLGKVHDRTCYFIEPKSHDNFFNRGKYYGDADDVYRYAFFSRAALEFMYKTGKTPEVIHCHDWQTGLVPVMLFEIYQHIGMHHCRVCYTIHNFKHQGVTGESILHASGLGRPDYYMQHERLHDNVNRQAVNLMKAGIVYSNFVTTVSMRHSIEAKDQDQGYGLGQTLQIHHNKFGGVLNGVDYDVWNPEIDNYIPAKFGIKNIDGKYKNKKALRERLLLEDNQRPIISFVGRLDHQKGLDLVLHAIYHSINNGCQFVLLGSSPDQAVNNNFWRIKHELNDNPNVHLEIGYDEELAHLIYAGSDIMIIPSHFEPCGLTQLIALKYGTIPVVRAVGGLADTVFDKDFCEYKSMDERNGFVFHQPDVPGINSALDRAIGLYYDYPEDFRKLMISGMKYDYSWNHPGEHYVNIYDYIRE